MSNLKVFNSDVIPVYTTDEGNKVVLARELHEKLGIKTPYHKWFPRMTEYGFVDGEDFSTMDKNVRRADGTQMPQTQTDHIMTLDMAKHVAMIQRTPQGMAIRQKLIDLEKKVSEQNIVAEALCTPDAVIKLLTAYSDEQKKNAVLLAENNELKPKGEIYDAISATDDSIPIKNLANILNQNGLDIGQNRLFQWMRDNGYLIDAPRTPRHNTPTQSAMNKKLFMVHERPAQTPYGQKFVYTTRVTPKGQEYFIRKLIYNKNVNI